MIVYNVTLSIDPRYESEVVEWLKNEHIPEVMATGLFLKAELFSVHEQSGGPQLSFAVQYRLRSWKNFDQYQLEHAAVLQQKTRNLFGEHVLAYRTFLQQVWEFGESDGGQE